MKTINKITLKIILIGFVLFSLFIYFAFAFVLAEINPFDWRDYYRFIYIILISLYIIFLPATFSMVKDELL
jgi:hypothetical protein